MTKKVSTPRVPQNEYSQEGIKGMSRDRDPFVCAATTMRTEIARRPSSEGMFLDPVFIIFKNPYMGDILSITKTGWTALLFSIRANRPYTRSLTPLESGSLDATDPARPRRFRFRIQAIWAAGEIACSTFFADGQVQRRRTRSFLASPGRVDSGCLAGSLYDLQSTRQHHQLANRIRNRSNWRYDYLKSGVEIIDFNGRDGQI
jgi:hypothetical protein